MKTEKFKFIELPRPEITISEFGMSELLGGLLCSSYTICIAPDSANRYNGLEQCKVPDYDLTLDCHGNPIGCSGSMFCEHYSQPCAGVLISNSCKNYCGGVFN